jgi:NDP-sugar pyrophosphorylase family protein
VFRTAIDRHDNKGVVVNVFYKHSRIKQYLKDGRAMRIETVVNAPRDLGCNARLHNLDELQTKARACNRRILDAQACRPGLCACQSSL